MACSQRTGVVLFQEDEHGKENATACRCSEHRKGDLLEVHVKAFERSIHFSGNDTLCVFRTGCAAGLFEEVQGAFGVQALLGSHESSVLE